MINVDLHETQPGYLPENTPPFRFRSAALSNNLGAYISIKDSASYELTIYFTTCETIALFREALQESEDLLLAAQSSPPLQFVEVGCEA